MQVLKPYPEPVHAGQPTTYLLERPRRVYLAGLRRSGQWRDEEVLAALCGAFGRIIWDQKEQSCQKK